MTEYVTQTIHFQLQTVGEKEVQEKIWADLRNLHTDVFKAANLAMSHLHFLESLENQFLQAERTLEKDWLDLNKKIKKDKKMSEEEKDQAKAELERIGEQRKGLKQEVHEKTSIFLNGRSKDNAAYMYLTNEFEQQITSSYMRRNLAKMVTDKFKNDWQDVKSGKKSISNFKKDLPIPIDHENIAYVSRKNNKAYCFVKEENDLFYWQFSPLKMSFKIMTEHYNGKYIEQDKNKRTTLQRIMNFEYLVGNSQMQIKNGKLFLLVVCKVPKKEFFLDPEICVGVDLGIRYPACVATNGGLERKSIGSMQDFNKVRQRFYEHRRRLQKNLQMTAGGKGREDKLKALERVKQGERNFTRTYNHTLSKKIVEFALLHRAGTIKMELLEGYGKDENGQDEKSKFILRFWSYYELQSMIEQKAQAAGIVVLKIDPYHTSQKCHACGEKGKRDKAKFTCENPACKQHEKEQNADHNAAINIARSTHFVVKKEDCFYYQKKQEEKAEKKRKRNEEKPKE